ncbi:MBL fold metallo-hydrolase [Halopseudomonas nanhaiensis]|uniref:MBL fold metallo-hydrolase RNA specificity domain-containing protein n=1 Tax=Halopseudomonas nanhaiensis TaxID=2830842 RepID=UPI001CBD5784|nr:MBL fold metallo-hydrolase [Halopseudomonas nanhaiensis]UAW99462.1 MBL fold metallo-hydrolase [Halopseudomonas nanhaiensis]
MSGTYPFIEHHGAVQGVTGSCHQLWLTEHDSLLVDCGMFQGAELSNAGAGAGKLEIEFDLSSVRALIATHVHIDHIGRLPWLIAAGFKGPVHCTEPSAMLMPAVLEDAFMLSVKRDRDLTEKFLALVEPMLQGHAYREWISLIDRDDLVCRVRFRQAGHILGSAWVEVDVRYPATGAKHRIVFSGDLGAPHAPLLPPPKSAWQADVVVLESTYGDRLHEDRRTRRERLQKALESALADGGTVLIPAFSIGRTQELLYEIEAIISSAKKRSKGGPGKNLDWENLPIILDAPLATRFTTLYRQLKPWWDKEALRRVRQGHKPLGFEQLLTVDSHDKHIAMVNRLAQTKQPAVVITSNGMCSAGRIVNYLKAMLHDPRHNVLFVGYQARGTPGRDIQQYGPGGGWVELDGERYDIRAGIETLGGYSAHADQKGLVKFVTGMRHWPRQVRLVHGDDAAKQRLAGLLKEAARRKGVAMEVVIPTA